MTEKYNFSLPVIHTNEYWSLADAHNQPVMLTFWTTWCPDCLRDLEQKQRLFESMTTKKLVTMMIHVTSRDPDADVHSFLEKNKYTFPVVIDDGRKVYDQFRCTSVPTTILLNSDHEVVRIYDDKATMIDIAEGLSQIIN